MSAAFPLHEAKTAPLTEEEMMGCPVYDRVRDR